jgi:hypothetical protein
MSCWIEIYQDRRLIHKENIWLWYLKGRPWEQGVQSRERQLNKKIERLLKSIAIIDTSNIQVFIKFKSKMNNDHTNRVLQRSVDHA